MIRTTRFFTMLLIPCGFTAGHVSAQVGITSASFLQIVPYLRGGGIDNSGSQVSVTHITFLNLVEQLRTDNTASHWKVSTVLQLNF